MTKGRRLLKRIRDANLHIREYPGFKLYEVWIDGEMRKAYSHPAQVDAFIRRYFNFTDAEVELLKAEIAKL